MAKDTDTGDYFKQWQAQHKINSRDQYDAISLVRERFTQSRNALQTTCYHDSVSGDGSSWYDRREKQVKASIMWSVRTDSDDFSSNIKSPMSRGRISAFVNQFKKLNLQWEGKPNNPEDRNSAFMASILLNNWFDSSNAKGELNLVAESCAMHGSSIFRVCYLRDTKKVRLSGSEPETDEEKKEAEEGKTVYGKATEETVHDDVILEYVPLDEFYYDPQAWYMHGPTFAARWAIRRRFVNIEDVRHTYEDNNDVIKANLKKVKPAYSYFDDSYSFFRPPTEVSDKSVVELIEYEDKVNDRYIVIANDILLIDTPLPYNHKELTFHKVDFVKMPGQFFHLGIPDLLLNIQGSMEYLMNMAADYIYKSYNYRLAVSADNYVEIARLLSRGGDEIIPVDTADGNPMSSKIMPLTNTPIGFDLFRLMDMLEQNATMATQIDPSQLALMSSGKTATGAMLNKQQLEAMIGGVIENFINDGLRTAGTQVWQLMQQFYSIPRVKEIEGEEDEKKFRVIRLEGVTIDLNDKTKLLEESKSDDFYSFFEVKGEYLNSADEVDIGIRPESKQITNRALEQQKMKEDFAQLTQFAVDPDNPQAVAQHPLGMVNARKLFEEYFEVEQLPQELLLNPEAKDKVQIQEAEEHVIQIVEEGKNIPGVPGRGTAHRRYEAQVLIALHTAATTLEQEIEEDMKEKAEKLFKQPIQPQMNPMTGQMEPPIPPPPPEPDPVAIKKLEKLKGSIERLQQHLVLENMPAGMAEEAAIAGPQQQQPPSAPMPSGGGMPAGPQPEMPAPMGIPGAPNAI